MNKKEDKIVTSVVRQFLKRSEVGIAKYGTTLEENNEDDFLQHAIEESMDFILYLTKIKSILKEKGFDKLQDIDTSKLYKIGYDPFERKRK